MTETLDYFRVSSLNLGKHCVLNTRPETTVRLLFHAAEHFSDRIFIEETESSLSFADVKRHCLRIAAGLLADGFEPGDRAAGDGERGRCGGAEHVYLPEPAGSERRDQAAIHT